MKRMKWEKIKEKLAKAYNAPNGIDIRKELKREQGKKEIKKLKEAI